MLFWALLASGQITMRRVDGWQTLDRSPTDLDLAASTRTTMPFRSRAVPISTTFATRPLQSGSQGHKLTIDYIQPGESRLML